MKKIRNNGHFEEKTDLPELARLSI